MDVLVINPTKKILYNGENHLRGIDDIVTKSLPTSQELYAILNNLSFLTKLNIYSHGESSNSHFVAEFIPKPKALPGFDIHTFKTKHGEFCFGNHEVVVYTDKTSLNYLVVRFQISVDEPIVIIGPFLFENPGNNITSEYGQHENFAFQDNPLILDYFRSLKILDTAYLHALAGLLFALLNSPMADPKIRILKSEPITQLEDRDHMKNQKQLDTINLHHSKLKDLLHYVEQGDQDKALKVLSSIGSAYKDKTRLTSCSFKNLALDLNVRLQMVADKAQVSPYELHTKSNRFLSLIEDIHTTTSLFQVQKEMVISYCKLINESHTSGLSKPIIDAVHFIDKHVDKKIPLLEISHHVGINDSHLSRQFKKEMGKTVTNYINERKIIKAKHYLENSNHSITTISTLCGFENHNYFSKVFKLYTGYTPKEFQKNIPPKERTF